MALLPYRTMIIVAFIVILLSNSRVEAADLEGQTALVGCDLISQEAPSVRFLQLGAGDGRLVGPDIEVGIQGITTDPRDVAGRSCAQILADLLDDGFRLREVRIVGRNQDLGLWYWQRKR